MKLSKLVETLKGYPDNADVVIRHSGFRGVNLQVITKISDSEQVFTTIPLRLVKQPGGAYQYQ